VAKVYVVTAPERIRGIYESWPACEAAVKGVRGARYQAVASREQAESMLRGEGTSLARGRYAFVDGNHMGGVDATKDEPTVDDAIGLTVREVFAGGTVASLTEPAAIATALARLRNILAELGALYLALRLAPEGDALTVVHDYEGVGAWMTGRWKTKDPLVGEIVAACHALADARRLALTFRHQRGHQSAWAGRDDFAHFNARADALASEAVEA
jgi:ribonuclease HI